MTYRAAETMALEALARRLADCAEFRAMVGASTVEAALARIDWPGVEVTQEAETWLVPGAALLLVNTDREFQRDCEITIAVRLHGTINNTLTTIPDKQAERRRWCDQACLITQQFHDRSYDLQTALPHVQLKRVWWDTPPEYTDRTEYTDHERFGLACFVVEVGP